MFAKSQGENFGVDSIGLFGMFYTKDEDTLWSVGITTDSSRLGNIFPDFTDKLGLHSNKGNASINIPVEESEVLPTLKRIVSAWCSEKDGDVISEDNEKDV